MVALRADSDADLRLHAAASKLSSLRAQRAEIDALIAAAAAAERDAWVEQRRSYIGASEAAAVLGIDPFSGPLQVWARKVLGEQGEQTEAMRAGNDFEPVILARYARRMGVTLEQPGTLRHPDHAFIGATPDAIANGRVNVQAKMVGVHAARHWGPESDGAEGVPDHYLVQVQIEMAVANLDVTHVAAQIGTELRVYRVERHRDLAENVIDLEVDFWHRHIATGSAPEGDWTPRLLVALHPRALRPLAPAPPAVDGLVAAYMAARDAEKKADEAKKAAATALMQKIGDGDGFKGDWGTVRWREQRGRVDWDGYARALGGNEIDADGYRGEASRVIDVRPPKKTKD